MEILRQGTTKERPLQASKWLECQLLVDKNEMTALFDALGNFFLYTCGAVVQLGQAQIAKETFLENYGAYVEMLKNGVSPNASSFRSLFSPAMTVTTDALFSVPIAQHQEVIRVCKPVVQLQSHHMHYSAVDKKFHPMVFGSDSITWGIQFSYPQLYQDDQTKQVEAVKDTPGFPNTRLFQTLQKWVRQHTIPTPFLVEGISINVPMRLGKQCLSWINQHPHLTKKEIVVK